jgi:tetratricopeptide (TPR) repeat protein
LEEQLREWVIDIAKKELEMNQDVRVERHADLLHMLGMLYKGQGNYQASQPLLEEALEKRRATLGADHPDTLLSINNLAMLYYMQRKYDTAEPLYLECLEKQKSTLEADHPSTLPSINNLALLYKSQGKYNTAEPLYLECLDKRNLTLAWG